MRCCDSVEVKAWTTGIWLIGLGFLFATRFWWPGLVILIGITAIVQGVLENQSTTKIRGGLFMILLGVWAALRFPLAFLLIGLGVFVIIKSLLRSSESDSAKKPYFDNTLE